MVVGLSARIAQQAVSDRQVACRFFPSFLIKMHGKKAFVIKDHRKRGKNWTSSAVVDIDRRPGQIERDHPAV